MRVDIRYKGRWGVVEVHNLTKKQACFYEDFPKFKIMRRVYS